MYMVNSDLAETIEQSIITKFEIGSINSGKDIENLMQEI